MKYYAHFGHKDFILCLGYRGDLIKEFFLNYNECLSNDFVLTQGNKVELKNSDIHDWRITFADTGANSNIGQRLKAVEKYLQGEDMFLANYSDGLSDLPLDKYLDNFNKKAAIASFVGVRPSQSFHGVTAGDDGYVRDIGPVHTGDFWINGGFFALRREIFRYMHEGDELVEAPFKRLIKENSLISYKYTGFWAAMDTFKDKKMFDTMYEKGDTPWAVWR
jgi:glucose-1-phosphate cytidylyltransferase